MNKKIKFKFNKNADNYDIFSDIQKKIANELIKFSEKNIKKNNIKKIADLGCGTGCLSEKILKILPNKEMDCIDFSEKMLICASMNLKSDYIKFINNNIMNLDYKKYQIIFSNMSLHWLGNNLINLIENKIEKSQEFFFSIPIEGTFSELKNLFLKNNLIDTIMKFQSAEKILEICQEKWNVKYQIKSFEINESVKNIFSQIKKTGSSFSEKSNKLSDIKKILNVRIKTYYKILFVNCLLKEK